MTGVYENMNKKRDLLYKKFDLSQLKLAKTKKFDSVLNKQISKLNKDIVIPRLENLQKYSSWNYPKEIDIY